MKISVYGIAWFRRETYDRCRTIFEDGSNFASTYELWIGEAEKVAKLFESKERRSSVST